MNVLTYFKNITAFVFDVDGVLTDGTVLLLPDGTQARQMNIKDGLALQMAQKQGYTIIIISGGYSEPVVQRFRYLEIEEVYLAIKNKTELLQELLAKKKMDWQHVLYMGDDLPDIPVLKKAGLPCCPTDAVAEVKQICKYISPQGGGYGCVRDVIEKVLKLNDHWQLDAEVTSR